MIGRRFLVRGRVQGVFFRAHTQQVAEPLGLVGHAINLCDGRVEVLAYGEQAALDELEDWLHEGSPAASVEAVQGEPADVPATLPDGFRTG